jgi:hypothetical protein
MLGLWQNLDDKKDEQQLSHIDGNTVLYALIYETTYCLGCGHGGSDLRPQPLDAVMTALCCRKAW